MAIYYDNTRISDFRTCPRYFYLRHIRHQVRSGISAPLVFGLSWHEAMDVLWKFADSNKTNEELLLISHAAFLRCWVDQGYPAEPTPEQNDRLLPRTPMVGMEMLYSYIEERRQWIEDVEILSIEQPFAVTLEENGTGDNVFNKRWYIGRLDKVIRKPGEGIYVIEHKTTSSYAKASGFRSSYIESWSPNSQVDGYLHAAHMLYGKSVRGLLIDAALVHKTEHNRFKFIPIDRQFAQLNAWLQETRDWIERIENEKSRRPAEGDDYFGFPKNTGSCNNYGGCTYRDICRFVPNPHRVETFAEFTTKKWEPFDILKIEKLGMEKE